MIYEKFYKKNKYQEEEEQEEDEDEVKKLEEYVKKELVSAITLILQFCRLFSKSKARNWSLKTKRNRKLQSILRLRKTKLMSSC
jgi:hypothetical protein